MVTTLRTGPLFEFHSQSNGEPSAAGYYLRRRGLSNPSRAFREDFKNPSSQSWLLPIVSIVVPFWGLPFRILHIELVKPEKEATMETTGRVELLRGLWLQVDGDSSFCVQVLTLYICLVEARRTLKTEMHALGLTV